MLAAEEEDKRPTVTLFRFKFGYCAMKRERRESVTRP